MSAHKTAILLDAMGTILRLEVPWPLLAGALQARGAPITEEEARTALLAEIAYYRAHHDEGRDATSLQDLRDRCTEVLREALPAHAREVDDLQGALLTSLRFQPYPEVPYVLGALRNAGRRIVIVSNWDVSLHDVLVDTGLDGLVTATLTSAEAGASKPDAAIFERALELADAPAAQALHVGDHLEADARGATAAGIDALLLVRRGAMPPPGVRMIGSLTELLPVAL